MKAVVLYDADCGFCVWSVELVKRLDGRERLEPLALQTPGVLERYGISREAADNALHVVSGDGMAHLAGHALMAIVRELPWLWPAAYLWWLPGFAWLADRAYFLVADNRHLLSRRLGLSKYCNSPQRT